MEISQTESFESGFAGKSMYLPASPIQMGVRDTKVYSSIVSLKSELKKDEVLHLKLIEVPYASVINPILTKFLIFSKNSSMSFKYSVLALSKKQDKTIILQAQTVFNATKLLTNRNAVRASLFEAKHPLTEPQLNIPFASDIVVKLEGLVTASTDVEIMAFIFYHGAIYA